VTSSFWRVNANKMGRPNLRLGVLAGRVVATSRFRRKGAGPAASPFSDQPRDSYVDEGLSCD
jgi:hypothetical protein